MLLCCPELTELGSHLLVERPWQWVGNEGVVGNGVDVLDHVIQEVPVRAERESSKQTSHLSQLHFNICSKREKKKKTNLKHSTPKA